MRLLNFIQSLLPRMGKDEVMEDLRVTAGELTNGAMPVFADAAKFFKSSKFKSEKIKELETIFFRNYTLTKSGRGNMVAEIESKLKNVFDNLTFVSDQNEELLEADIMKDGLTAKKAILVRSAEHLSFMTRYAIDLLNLIYIEESKAAGATNSDAYSIPPMMETRISGNIANFGRLLSHFGDSKESFKKHFDGLPDVVVNNKTYHALAAVYNENKLDPIGAIMLQGFEGNPIYHFRIMIAEWQANRYKAYKDKKKMLELRLLNLKMLQEENFDPRLENEIQYIQNRIDGIEYKMAKMEDSVK